jgi:hypothetical protein
LPCTSQQYLQSKLLQFGKISASFPFNVVEKGMETPVNQVIELFNGIVNKYFLIHFHEEIYVQVSHRIQE